MKIKMRLKKLFSFFTILCLLFMLVLPTSVFAEEQSALSTDTNATSVTTAVSDSSSSLTTNLNTPSDSSAIAATPVNPNSDTITNKTTTAPSTATAPNAAYVAKLTIYADSDSTSSWSTSGHAWITVKNISSSNITVGRLSGMAPGRMISVGTWGNKSEHTGLWYNLETEFYANYGAFTTSKSLTMNITANQLSTINTYIINNDAWSITNNCSSFASGLWNSVATVTVSAGTPNTPTSLKNSIMSKPGYSTGSAMTYNYVVYYANGTGRPIRSTQY